MRKKCFVALLLVVAGLFLIFGAYAEELYSCWVLCQPNDYVNVREKPSRKGILAGRFDSCDELITDGKIRNGYLHVVNMTLEASDVWIHQGYVVYDKPQALGGQLAVVVSRARLAARKYIGGKVRKWLKNGDEVKVYYLTEEWAVTNKGFIKSQYIELEGY